MYEVTLSVEKQNTHFLNYVENIIAPVLNKVNGVTASQQSNSRSYLSLACVDTFKKQVSDMLSTLLTDCLGIGYKNIFLRQQLSVDDSNFLVNTLINTMCVFDSNFDRQYIKRILKLEGNIYLDGYFNFRLKRLKEKWQEIIELTNNNNIILSDDSLIEEFLAYLTESIPQSIKELSVVVDDKIWLYDSHHQLLPSIDILHPQATAEEQAMVNIICLRPSAVTLYCDADKVDKQFLSITKLLFNAKVVKNA